MHKEVEFLEYIVHWLVANKQEVKIERIEDELGVLLTLTVSKEDMWVIIWKAWNTVNALRSILRLLWAKLEKKINLKVLD